MQLGKDTLDRMRERGNVHLNIFDVHFKDISSGIVFLYASWGPTEFVFQMLMEHTPPEIALYILDIDESGMYEYGHINRVRSHGNGETFWITEGKMVACIKQWEGGGLERLLANNLLLTTKNPESQHSK